VLEIEPATVVELGVWTGGTAIPMAIALRHLGAGVLTAVDAWSPTASAEGQEGEHAAWWRRVGADGHENARSIFLARLDKHGIPREQCVVLHGRSDDAPVPDVIDILHIDANHGPQAAADAGRWARAVRIGGVLIINDLEWPGGHMLRARDRAIELGFVETRRIEGGCMMRRTSQKTNQQTEGP
jgi:SAM-dependent methyltransferase